MFECRKVDARICAVTRAELELEVRGALCSLETDRYLDDRIAMEKIGRTKSFRVSRRMK